MGFREEEDHYDSLPEPAKRFRFKIPIGDWSGDGHRECEWFEVSSKKPVEAAREAYFLMQGKYPDLDPTPICSFYEDREIPQEYLDKIVVMGFKADNEVRLDDYTPEMFLEIVIWFINRGDPDLDLRYERDDVMQMFPFYGYDKKGRHISFFGYGLFIC